MARVSDAEEAVLRGEMAITHGAEFSQDLRNGSSAAFKALAFDVQRLVSERAGGRRSERSSTSIRRADS